jgi:hypothetical protein
MATTALIVEVLVVGVMALIWIVGTLALLVPVPAEGVHTFMSFIRDFIPLLLLPVLAVTYTAGWLVNFFTERALKWLFEERLRDQEFGDKPGQYELVRITVLQRASSDLTNELLLDRHIVRLARGAALNLFMSAVVAAVYGLRGHTLGGWLAPVCLVAAAGSFAQWRTRYRSHNRKIKRIFDMLLSTEAKSNQT